MKKFLIFLSGLFFFVSCATTKPFVIKENYVTKNFEILENNKLRYTLPFSRYCGYQAVDDRCYFIDCSESRIFEYGELCFFDYKTEKFLYSGIKSGSSFIITKNYIVASSLVNVETSSDIEDVFGIGLNKKEYPLNISIYDTKEYKNIKSFDLEKYREGHDFNSLFINIITDSPNEKVKVEYGIYDTNMIIPIGSINLKTLEIE